jgi:hypothetical protein
MCFMTTQVLCLWDIKAINYFDLDYDSDDPSIVEIIAVFYRNRAGGVQIKVCK